MGGKKKSASKSKSGVKPAKFTVMPASPAVTRSSAADGSRKSEVNKLVSPATPTLPVLIPTSAGAGSSTSRSSDINDLEKKFDDRMSRMETSFRSSITEMVAAQSGIPRAPRSSSATLAQSPALVPNPGVVASTPTPVAAPLEAAAKPPRRSSRSSSSSSSSSDDSDGSDTSRSSSSSRSRSRSSRRHRHRRHHRRHHSRKHSRSSSRPKHSKYSSARYLKEKETLKTYPRLVLVNVRMALALLKRKKDIKSFLKHMLLVAEKADSDMFMDDVLINYDESVKDKAKEIGMKSFRKVDPAVIMKHLCYDGTKAAANAKRAAVATSSKKQLFARTAQAVGHCIKFNYDSKGCPRGKDCFYKHTCSACGSTAHGNPDCTAQGRSKQK